MNRIKGRIFVVLLTLTLAVHLGAPALAAGQTDLEHATSGSAAYIYGTVKTPQVGSIGGEWAVLGLARSCYDVPIAYYQDYYATVENYVRACRGVLHDKKYTEYSRVIMALSAIGKDAREVAGYDLTKPLGDYEKTIWQGMNGPIWALIALDSANYPMPKNPEAKTQATRQMYIDRILACQLKDGGWSLLGGTASATTGDVSSDPDITGMALQALAKYQDQSAVAKATEEALACLSTMQDSDGGYGSWGTTNSESVVQVLVALTELGIPLDDPRFVKDGKTVLDNLLTYRQSDGSFLHAGAGGGSNQMAAEQGLYGLAAALRAQEGESSLYRMGDALSMPDTVQTGPAKGEGLGGKDPAVQTVPIISPGATFEDITLSPSISAIESLAARGIITGGSDGLYHPEKNMTRAEFAAVVFRALGLVPVSEESDKTYSDVAENIWYADYVLTVSHYGIVTGVGEGRFLPDGTITRQEAAVMTNRAAALCGMDTAMDEGSVRDMLAQFGDYTTSGAWARPALAFCYREGILPQSDLTIRPTEAATRSEIADMLFALLGGANLL